MKKRGIEAGNNGIGRSQVWINRRVWKWLTDTPRRCLLFVCFLWRHVCRWRHSVCTIESPDVALSQIFVTELQLGRSDQHDDAFSFQNASPCLWRTLCSRSSWIIGKNPTFFIEYPVIMAFGLIHSKSVEMSRKRSFFFGIVDYSVHNSNVTRTGEWNRKTDKRNIIARLFIQMDNDL